MNNISYDCSRRAPVDALDVFVDPEQDIDYTGRHRADLLAPLPEGLEQLQPVASWEPSAVEDGDAAAVGWHYLWAPFVVLDAVSNYRPRHAA